MGGRHTKEAEYKKEDPNFYRKQMITSHKTFSINAEYELLEKIGDGTYAEVFKGRSKRSKKLCAIKRVDKAKAKGIASLLENEFNILRELVTI
jgi:serine/threonine protein kinase